MQAAFDNEPYPYYVIKFRAKVIIRKSLCVEAMQQMLLKPVFIRIALSFARLI